MVRSKVCSLLVLTAVTVTFGAVVPRSAASAGDEPVIHFVVDVSGSMAGSKLEEAVAAVKQTVGLIDDDVAVGVRSYAGSCDQSGVAPVVGIGTDNDDVVIAGVDGLTAGGGTPTTAALEEAIKDVRAYGSTGAQRVVLLTDGDTQCGISICDFITSQDLDDLDLTMYTVGLQVGSAAAADLTCAAQATGGDYIPADDPSDLADALGEAAGGGDRDQDGLPDVWEDEGRYIPTLDAYDMRLKDAGAHSGRKDVFVLLDWEKSAKINDDAIALVEEAFAEAPVSNPDGSTGISLHIERGEQISGAQSDALQKVDAQGNVSVNWPAVADRLTRLERTSYRYAVSVSWEKWGPGGQADDIPGQFMVLNMCGTRTYQLFGTREHTRCQSSTTAQAVTLMHELGHTLGLMHGGRPVEDVDCLRDDLAEADAEWDTCVDALSPYKPNYLSVMNYSFLGTGIKGLGVDFSRWGPGELNILDESSLSEYDGVYSPNGSLPAEIKSVYYCDSDGSRHEFVLGNAVDWNCSRKAKEPGRVSANIDWPARERDKDWLGGKVILRPHDDWAWINSHARESLGGGSIGEELPFPPGDGVA